METLPARTRAAPAAGGFTLIERSVTVHTTMRPLVLLLMALGASMFAASADGDHPRILTGGVTTYTTSAGDSLRSIGARFGVDVPALAADNGLTPAARLAVGQALRVDNRHLVPSAVLPGAILINLPQRMLFFDADGETAGMPVAVGRPSWRTPIGPFAILTKETNPTWDVPISIREEARRLGRTLPATVPPGPDNPLGRFWLGLSLPGLGIHGTNAPSSVYGAVTHGCLRLGPEDIDRLFSRVTIGTTGRIVYEPILLAVVGDQILLEVHGDVYRRLTSPPRDVVASLVAAAGLDRDVDWARADAVIAARHGVARVVGTRENPRRTRTISR